MTTPIGALSPVSDTSLNPGIVGRSGATAPLSGGFQAALSEAVATLKAGEASAIAGVKGSASAQQVVEAVMAAEQTLQAAITIRDRVVAAYQEISRMTI